MRRKLLLILAVLTLACSLTIGTVFSVNAGLVENKPAGDGLITSTQQINNTNFRVVEVNEGDANAYRVSDSATGNHVLAVNTAGGMTQITLNKGVPAATMAKDATVTLTYKFVGIDAATSAQMQLLVIPGAKNVNEITYGYVLTGADNGMAVVKDFRPSAAATDPKSMLIAHHGNDAQFDASAGIQWQAYSWAAAGFASEIPAYGNNLFKMEMTINENDWVDVKLVRGFIRDGVENWHPGATITNWAPYDGTYDFFTNVYLGYASGVLIDDVKLTATYTEGGESKTDVICENDMNDATKVWTSKDKDLLDGAIVSLGSNRISTEPSGVVVTNPALGSGIATRGEIKVDTTLEKNFELNSKFAITSGTENHKVGVMFGLESGREIAGEHRYVYVRNTADGVRLGVESVDAEGVATAVIEEVLLDDVAVGDAVEISIVGANEGIVINAGTNEAITIETFDLNGYLAITHKGEGEMSYLIKDNLTFSSYEFLGNSEKATVLTSNFEGNYINANKFQQQSTVAPETHAVKGENTIHDLTGMVAEDGKLGFYGTSTNTRLLTVERYADFVMQFDYISIPALQRAQLTGMTRQSQFYMMFGMKEGGLPLVDPSVYAIGIYEGSADLGFYGDNGTVVSTLGMASSCFKPVVQVGSKIVKTESPDANSIPRYNAGGYDATKENNNVAEWYNEGTVGLYSFYNKTTRVKLVVVNNKVALYAAEVDTTTGAISGDYVKLIEFEAVDTEGYLGIGTDSPGWAIIDNLAITPVSREVALGVTSLDGLSATGLVADVAPADMDADYAPTPLDKPVLAVSEQKVTWTAVEGAKEYVVSVKSGSETIVEDTVVTGTEFDLSTITAVGTYRVTVEAIPVDENAKLASRANIDYVVEEKQPDSSSDTTTPPADSSDDNADDSLGCQGALASTGLMSVLALAGVVFIKKRKE